MNAGGAQGRGGRAGAAAAGWIGLAAAAGRVGLAGLVGVVLGGALPAPGALAGERTPPRSVEPADPELLEFLGGDDEIAGELGEFLARPRREPAERPGPAQSATPGQETAR